MTRTWDLEKAMVDWRRSLSALPPATVDELESHVRDSLDALAEVGMTGEEAFAHATSELGSSETLVDQIERAAPRTAWRAPAIGLLTGLLLHTLGGAILSTLDWLVVPVALALRSGIRTAYLGIAILVVLGPFLAIGGGLVLAPRVVARVEKARPFVRIAVVIGMGLFVMTSQFPWLALLRSHAGALEVFGAWHWISSRAREIMHWAAPLALGVATVAARRRAMKGSEHARFAFWALSGYALMRLGSMLWFFTSALAACVAELAGRDMEQATTLTSLVTPLLVILSVHACASRFAPPSRILRSRLTDLGALAVVLFALAASFGDNAVLFGLVESSPPPHVERLEAILWSHFGTSMLASLCLTPLAAAGLLRLRSA